MAGLAHRSTEDPVFLAVNDTQRRFGIPDELLDQLVEGTTLDLQPVPSRCAVCIAPQGGSRDDPGLRELGALQRYCYLVASVVGLVCIRIFGYTIDERRSLPSIPA